MKCIVAAAAPDCRPGALQQNKVNIISCIRQAKADGACLLVLPAGCLTGMAGALEDHSLLQKSAEAALAEIRAAAGDLPLQMAEAPISPRQRAALPRKDILPLSSDRPATALSRIENEEMAARLSAEKQHCLVIACPRGGDGTDFVYDGHCLIAKNGHILASAEGYVCADLNGPEQPPKEFIQEEVSSQPQNPWLTLPELWSRVLQLQALGLARRLTAARSRTAVLGVSGGLDSTLALLVCHEAMTLLGRPASDILAVTMPCFGTTERTRSNARIMAEALGAEFLEVDITSSVRQHLRDIGHDADRLNNAFENAQARERTQVLMDLANDRSGLVVGTGDLSEIALGWCTYNGDHMSMYGVNAGLPKTVIRLVLEGYAAACENMELARSIRDVLDTPVSPELLPASDGTMTQLTEDLIGPYELHDFFLYYFLRYGFDPATLLRLAADTFADRYDRDTVKKWLGVFLRRFFSSQFKRSCSPDAPAVLGLSLSPRCGFRMPTDASGELWLSAWEQL